ncbi:MAG: NHL repeat-containing protein, partial [Thermomicrobiales bacterium]
LGAWRDLLTGPGSGQPVALFLLVLIVYELLAIIFALVGIASDRGSHGGATALLAAWGLAAFCLWSFSSGRLPENAVHIVLPVALLAGLGLGETFRAIQWENVWRGSSGLLALALLGVLIAGAGTAVLYAQRDQYPDPNDGIKPPIAVLCLVVVPLLYVIWRIGSAQYAQPATRSQPLLMALFVLAVLFGALGYRSANLLAFERTDSGLEILAQQTSTEGTLPSVQRLLRLARDIGVNQGTPEDPTGSHTMSIEIERDLAWPYVWYFREFPALTLVDSGQAGQSMAQAVIAADGATLTAQGYRVTAWPWRTQTPPEYLEPNIPDLFRYVVTPTKWIDFWRYILFRRNVAAPPPVVVSLGLQPELASRVQTPTGPFALGQSPGSGTEAGQFRDPIGVAVAPDGTILVVDSGNTRVQRFTSDGAYLDSWGGSANVGLFTRTDNGLGPTGITLGPDGVAWVADTWGHRVVALSPDGQVVRTIGSGVVDLQNDPARVAESPGSFFGPRAVAISDDAIYIVDTGNERVQKFAPDGSFELAWGGYGTEPNHLIEPVGIAIGPDGNIYVADSGNARIAIFTPDGEPVAQWPVADWPEPVIGGTPPSFQPYLAFDAAGNLYASASNAGEVLQLGPDGEILNRIMTAGGQKLAQPVGVAIDPRGNLLISDVGRDGVFTATPPPAAPPRSGPATPVG